MEEYDRKGVVIMSAIDKLIQIANAEVGYLEKSSNSQLDSKTANAGTANYTKYWRDIKPEYQGQPWCACFVTWCFVIWSMSFPLYFRQALMWRRTHR